MKKHALCAALALLTLAVPQAGFSKVISWDFTSTVLGASYVPTVHMNCDDPGIWSGWDDADWISDRCTNPDILPPGQTGLGRIAYDTASRTIITCDLGLGAYEFTCPWGAERSGLTSLGVSYRPERRSLSIWYNSNYDILVGMGVGLTAGAYSFKDDYGYYFFRSADIQFSNVTFTPVPAPPAWALLASAVLGVPWLRPRRRLRARPGAI